MDEAYGGTVPVYGGSAADDDLRGEWRVFAGATVAREGFALIGFATPREVHGSFVAGYAPTAMRGIVTAATGRIVQTIDGQPAARVYDGWSGGRISAQLATGGVVLAATSLQPVGRQIDRVGSVPRYLLSHPHEVLPGGSLAFFTDMKVGDELVLMLGSSDSLLDRTRVVAHRALGAGSAPLAGGVLTYCGGCGGVIEDTGARRVAQLFAERIGSAPFIGAATFGEQGCFLDPTPTNRHGNLMCNAVLFER
ncbi:MAG: FIST C-terminal domain-containing protein [Myxococcales bacterium]|nr:FIST C-terminal domain-containing protein [Myxococcales bacterium]